jgi:hypothetical protein
VSPLFFGDILEHLFIQEEFGHEPLEPLDLDFELATASIGIDLFGVVSFSPAMVGGLGDADLAAEVRDGESFGQVAVGVFEQSSHFVVGPSLVHGSLPVQVYRGTSISGGPTFGGQPNKAGVLNLARKGHEVRQPSDLVKDPFVLEFAGLRHDERYFESDLERALIAKLQHFLLELG